MHVLGVLGRGASMDELERVVDRIVDHLADRGRVGVLRYDGTIADGTADPRITSATVGGDVTYDLGADGDWAASGTGMTVQDALDTLATDCSYAVVVGVPSLRFPSILVGEDRSTTDTGASSEETPSNLVATARSAATVDCEELVEAAHRADSHETLDSLVERVTNRPEADRGGAVATFTGRVRAKDDPSDPRTEYLEFEKYDEVADDRMEAIRTELEARDGVLAVELYHRTGVVSAGEDIVYVVVLAGHRDAAFRTVEDGIDRLKDEVPLFKKEVTVEDEFWVHGSAGE